MLKAHVTLKEVAAFAGVSYQTVSKVINHQIKVSADTEERIWQAVETLGYKPSYTARSLRTQRALTIGYSWAPAPENQSNPILDKFLQSMFVAAEQHGYYLLCFPYHEDSSKHLATYNQLMDTGRVDGFILSNTEYDDPRILLLLERKFPFVAFGRSNPEFSFPWIDIDGAEGIRQEVNHIIEQGHQKVAALAWPANSRYGNDRLAGYLSEMETKGLKIHPAWIKRGEGRFDFGYQATLELLDLPQAIRPTALVAMNDLMAIGAIEAAKTRKIKIGEEFAVGGFDNYPLVEYIDPPLTTLSQPITEVGYKVIDMLISVIHSRGDLQPPTVLLRPKLEIRKSTLRG